MTKTPQQNRHKKTKRTAYKQEARKETTNNTTQRRHTTQQQQNSNGLSLLFFSLTITTSLPTTTSQKRKVSLKRGFQSSPVQQNGRQYTQQIMMEDEEAAPLPPTTTGIPIGSRPIMGTTRGTANTTDDNDNDDDPLTLHHRTVTTTTTTTTTSQAETTTNTKSSSYSCCCRSSSRNSDTDTTNQQHQHSRSRSCRSFWCQYCCCSCCGCILLLLILFIILYFTVNQSETDDRYIRTCTTTTSNTSTTTSSSSSLSSIGIGETPPPFLDMEELDAAAMKEPNFDNVPIYQTYFTKPNNYHRLHLHIISIQKKDILLEENNSTTTKKKRNRYGGFFQDRPTAQLIVKAQGNDTGSGSNDENHFQIGTHEFPPIKASKYDGPIIFDWDWKGIIIYKKEINETESILFDIMDHDLFSKSDTLLKFALNSSDLPLPTTTHNRTWKEYRISLNDDDDSSSSITTCRKYKNIFKDTEFIFRLKVSNDYFVTSHDMKQLYNHHHYHQGDDNDNNNTTTERIQFREHVLNLQSGDHAVLQVWKHNEWQMNSTTITTSDTTTNTTTNNSQRRAALWIIGKADGFMHPHVVNELFFNSEHPVDLYVLHWRYNGRCQARGFMNDYPLDNSHNPCGTADLYTEEIQLALNFIHTGGIIVPTTTTTTNTTSSFYDKVLGYGHSTGAAYLLNYIIEHGDNDFDAFVLNSPFLDWAHIAWWAELVLDYVPKYFTSTDILRPVPDTPPELVSNPVRYLEEEIIINTWGAKNIYLLYYSDWADRIKYYSPITVGFVRSVNSAFRNLNQYKKKRRRERKRRKKDSHDVTTKPVLVLTSAADDVVGTKEIIERSKNIRPDRKLIQFRYNSHDVFLSSDMIDSMLAVEEVKIFLQDEFYY